jgi:hypothetical protein
MVFVEAPSRAAGFMNYKVPGSGRPLRKAGMRPEGHHYKRKEGKSRLLFPYSPHCASYAAMNNVCPSRFTSKRGFLPALRTA